METQIGKVIKFFPKINVAIIEPSQEIKIGDKIIIRGSGNIEMTIKSMQINHKEVESATETFGLKIPEIAKEGDLVFKIEED